MPAQFQDTRREADGDGGWPSVRLGWLAVVILSLAAVISQLDRVVITLLVAPIKAEFGLSDASFGALLGIAFGVSYTLANLLAGWLADRFVRSTVVGAGLALFSVFSMATGFARGYGQLFAARAGVGVGEASVFPAGFSIISDYFPPRRLGFALGVFMMSSMVGIGLAFVAGGALIGWIADASTLQQLAPGMSPWRLTIILVALPGLLLTPLVFMIPEPPRHGARQDEGAGIRELWAAIMRRKGAFALISAAMAVVTLVHYATLAWAPALFMRVHHEAASVAGLRLGIIFLIFATSGTVVAGWLCDVLARRGIAAAPLKVAAIGFLGAGLFGALAPLMPDAGRASLFYAPYVFCVVMPYPCAATAIQLIFPNRLRARASGLYLTIINLVGYGIGPPLVGQFNDHLFTGADGVRHSMALVAGVGAPLMTAIMLCAARCYPSGEPA